FLEATQPSLNKQDTAASKLPPPPPRPAAAAGSVPKSDPAGSDRDTVEQCQKTDVTIHTKSSGQDDQAGVAAARTGEATGEGHASSLCGWF
ncbi:unnamed protein product, partial [Ectocarpus sp. 12 AP-2014]